MAYGDFTAFFRQAVRKEPFPYQQRLAQGQTMPEVVRAPTGTGKTATAVLGWLWRRRFHPHPEVRAQTPRRLIYALPMRVLVEQTIRSVQSWLDALGLTESVGLYHLMGGASDDDWIRRPEQEAILVGTQDMLLSRALNRGYGLSRFRWPPAFGLLNSDALWVVDEVQLMGPGLATTLQLDGLRRRLGTAGPTHTIWMSATLAPEWLETVDRPRPSAVLELDPRDHADPELRPRLQAMKQVNQADTGGGVRSREYPQRVAGQVLAQHVPGTLTLVILNTVERAQEIFKELEHLLDRESPTHRPERLLLHSRFRGAERQSIEGRLQGEVPRTGLIAVTTQVVEAGVDLSARTLFTELAPWPALVQRFGRCNRRGEDPTARVFWLDVEDAAAAPYRPDELAPARQALAELEGRSVSPGALPDVPFRLEEGEVLRLRDLVDLFDTAPDLSGNDLDVGRFIREGPDLDLQVFWRDWNLQQPPVEDEPEREELCPVPVYVMRRFLGKPGRRAWAWDHLADAWRPVVAADLLPGMTLLLHTTAGGYTPERGWDGSSSTPVPQLGVRSRVTPQGVSDDHRSFTGVWQTLQEHTDQVVAEVQRVLDVLPQLQPWQEALLLAARWHDAGKAHAVFQATMAAVGPPAAGPAVGPPAAGPDGTTATAAPEAMVWAKAGGRPRRHSRRHFRHELASALALLQLTPPVTPLVLDLAAYLVAAHHGRVRLSIRSLPGEVPPADPNLRYALGIHEQDSLLAADLGGGVRLPGLQIANLDLMDLGRRPEAPARWIERTLALRDRPDLGPFRLAFLEACLRAADVRASMPLPPVSQAGPANPRGGEQA